MQTNIKTEEDQHSYYFNISSSHSLVERVIVSVRLRPFTEEEYLRDRQSCIENFDVSNKIILGNISPLPLIILEVKKEFEKKIFNFDFLLDPQIYQREVYDLVASDVVEVYLTKK